MSRSQLRECYIAVECRRVEARQIAEQRRSRERVWLRLAERGCPQSVFENPGLQFRFRRFPRPPPEGGTPNPRSSFPALGWVRPVAAISPVPVRPNDAFARTDTSAARRDGVFLPNKTSPGRRYSADPKLAERAQQRFESGVASSARASKATIGVVALRAEYWRASPPRVCPGPTSRKTRSV